MKKNNVKIKIGLDFHGVITDNPEYFHRFTELAEKKDWEIYVITGGPYAVIVKFLKTWGIKYHKLFTILDFYDAQGKVTFFENGNFHIDDDLWDKAKGVFCSENKIDFHIDDSRIYGKYYTTPYCLYDKNKGACEIEGGKIDLSHSPETALLEIENYINKKSSR